MMAPEPEPVPGTGVGLASADGRAKKLQFSLNDDGTLYLRMAMWLQVWARSMQMNPGSTVLGDTNDWYHDVAIRRARFLFFGQIFPRTFILMHFGINNQTFRNARKPQLYFHDAWLEFEASDIFKVQLNALAAGAGMTGLGMLTPVGNDVDTSWQNILAGKSGAATIESFDEAIFPARS